MRSTNLVLVLVLLNVSAGIIAVAAPVDVDPLVGGDAEIDDSAGSVEDRDVSRRGSGELIGSFLGLGSLIQDIGTIIFFGPEMLRNLGAPGLIVTGFEVVLVFVLSFDIAEAITGRRLS
jgi:hypothetical protein